MAEISTINAQFWVKSIELKLFLTIIQKNCAFFYLISIISQFLSDFFVFPKDVGYKLSIL